jgi:hypothetical protein
MSFELSILDKLIGCKLLSKVDKQLKPFLVVVKLIEIEVHELFVLLFQILMRDDPVKIVNKNKRKVKGE